jgi:hypothetical protein
MVPSYTDSTMATASNSSLSPGYNKLKYKWNIWAHLPQDADWTLKSYKKIYTMTCVEEAIAITETLPDILVKNCMLFLMREGIKPLPNRPEIKEIILDFEIFPRYNVLFAVDDRKQVIDMYRNKNIIVLDCAGEKGNF